MTRAALPTGLLTGLLAVVASGCVTGRYGQVTVNEPVDRAQLAALKPGEDTLETCLRALGAPVRVFEYRVAPDRTSGMALLWSWNQDRGWGVRASMSVRGASVSFDYGSQNLDLPGCVLWFDRDLVLERWREGRVGDLLPERVRPAPALDGSNLQPHRRRRLQR